MNVAQAIVVELGAGNWDWPGAKELGASPWITTHIVKDQMLVDALRLELDRDEAETIALAVQLGADLVLLDERPGRSVAEYLELRVMGVLGLLLRAKQLGLIQEVQPILNQLKYDAGFYVQQTLYDRVLALAGEA